MKYRKKPVVITALHWNGTAAGATPIIDWVLAAGGTARYECAIGKFTTGDGESHAAVPHFIAIDTLEGTMTASASDWIIRGVQGEFYPCKPDIFRATYDLAEEHA